MAWEELLLVVGRSMVASLFVLAGQRHRKLTAQLTQAVAAKGLPAPRVLVHFAIFSQLVGGLMLLLGVAVVPAAIGLVLFTVISSLVLVDFWNAQGQQRAMMMQQIQLNIAVVGGLMAVIVASLLLPSTLWLGF